MATAPWPRDRGARAMGVGKWIAGGVAVVGAVVGVVVLATRKKKPAPSSLNRPVDPQTEIYPPVEPKGGLGGVGAQVGPTATATVDPSTLGGFLDLGLSFLGLNFGLSDLLSKKHVIAPRIFFPRVYPTPEGDADLGELAGALKWPNSAFSIMQDQDQAFAGFYQVWPAMRMLREWLGARRIPFMMVSQKPPGFEERYLPALGGYDDPGNALRMGRGVRMSPAMITFRPKEARDHNLIWLPPSETPSFGPNAISGTTDTRAMANGVAVVWDGVTKNWTPIPWENFGLKHFVEAGPLVVAQSARGGDLSWRQQPGVDPDSDDSTAKMLTLRHTFTGA